MKTEQQSALDIQKDLEVVFSKHQLRDVIRAQFAELSEEHPEESEQEFVNEVLSLIFMYRQATPDMMVGALFPKFGNPQDIADALMILVEEDYLDFDSNTNKFSIVYDIDDATKEQLALYQYPMPMVVPPLKVTDNFSTGYMTIKLPVILNDGCKDRARDVCLDHLNRMNSVPLVLDIHTIESIEASYKDPVRKPEEDFSEYEKRRKQARIFYDESTVVMEGIVELSDEFWMTHRYDRRGRTYASGYHINTQGTDAHKAVIQLKNKELVK